MATWLLPGAPSQPSTIRASTECLFLTWRTRRVAVSKSKTMGQPHPGVPTGCRLYEPLDLGFGEVLPPCSSAFGRRRAQLQRELGTESKPIEAYRRNAVSGAQGRGPAC